MVGKADGLGHLQMREAGHDRVGVLSRYIYQSALQVFQQLANGVYFTSQPQSHIGSHLVVATAPGVQALARVAHQLGQTRFYIEVHVFQF